jgi:diacylglycerol kinase family enzyme
VIKKLNETYPDLAVWLTSAREDATRLARKGVEEGFDLILCAGGDGTVNEAINGVAGTGVPLGIIPLGTGNGLAREIGLSTRPLKACEMLRGGIPRSVHLGKTDGASGERYFVLLAGAGIDSFTIDRLEAEHLKLKSSLGFLSYFWVGFLSLFRYPYPDLSFTVDGREFHGTSGAVAKASLLAGRLAIAPSIRLSDPFFSLCLIRPRGPFRYLLIAVTFLLSFGKIRIADYIRGKEIEIRSTIPLTYQVDGEICGTLPVKIRLAPNALTLLYPKETL